MTVIEAIDRLIENGSEPSESSIGRSWDAGYIAGLASAKNLIESGLFK